MEAYSACTSAEEVSAFLKISTRYIVSHYADIHNFFTCRNRLITGKVDAVQKGFIRLSELKKKEKEEKKVLEKTTKGGGYLDEMDLPPCISDDEGGEWVEEEEEVILDTGDHPPAINLKEDNVPHVGDLTIST